jgi:N,N'-diacetyllegionaminate synthase
MQKKVIIIAEAGVNHNGDFDKAKKMIEAAAAAGADYVKFQTFKADKIVSKIAKKAEYQNKNTGDNDQNQYGMLKKLEIPENWYNELINFADSKGIKFLSTGFDEESIDFLGNIGSPFFKIPSGEITNKPYLEHIARKGKPMILSTGMATIAEIEVALEVIEKAGSNRKSITVLHCNTEYPTPMKDVNLLAMLHIKNSLGVEIGYSDHTLGIEVPVAAVALGATVIEKHFTLDKNLPGPDHAASLEPGELRAMVKAIRNIELAISGTGIKQPSASEVPNKVVARKSIHTKNLLNSGHLLTSDDLVMKRPGDGISPMEIDNIIGRKINQNLEAETKLKWEYLEK